MSCVNVFQAGPGTKGPCCCCCRLRPGPDPAPVPALLEEAPDAPGSAAAESAAVPESLPLLPGMFAFSGKAASGSDLQYIMPVQGVLIPVHPGTHSMVDYPCTCRK
jgi:hypothetical protein